MVCVVEREKFTFLRFQLQKEGGMEVVDCNNHVKTAISFFGPSCAINSLVNKYNPIGDNSDKYVEPNLT